MSFLIFWVGLCNINYVGNEKTTKPTKSWWFSDQGGDFGPAESGKPGNFRIGLEFGRQSKGNFVGKFGEIGVIGHFGGSGKSGISGVSGCRRSGISGRFPPVRLTNKPFPREGTNSAPSRRLILIKIALKHVLTRVFHLVSEFQNI